MKKTLILLFISAFMFGCSPFEDEISGFNSDNAKTDNLSQTISENINNYNIYSLENVEIFNNYMNDNAVDAAYSEDASNISTTADSAALEKKYLNIWKDELLFALTNLSNDLKKEDKEKLESLQNEWEKTIINNFEFEQNELLSDSYGVELGSFFNVMKVSAYKDAYKQRTMHIKYLHYLLETQTENGKEPEDCMSLRFKN